MGGTQSAYIIKLRHECFGRIPLFRTGRNAKGTFRRRRVDEDAWNPHGISLANVRLAPGTRELPLLPLLFSQMFSFRRV